MVAWQHVAALLLVAQWRWRLLRSHQHQIPVRRDKEAFVFTMEMQKKHQQVGHSSLEWHLPW